MSDCQRFEQEGLLQLERGETLDDHFSTCVDCRTRREAYETLTQSLTSLGADEHPPAGWQDRVRQQIQTRQNTTPNIEQIDRRTHRWWPIAALAAAAAVVIAVLILPSTDPADLILRSSIERGSTTFRGDEAARPGDTLRLEATGDPRENLELRLYRNERELIARCASSPATAKVGDALCIRRSNGLSLQLPLDAIGRYQPVGLSSPEPLAPAEGGLDADCGTVLAAGGRVELGDEITVR